MIVTPLVAAKRPKLRVSVWFGFALVFEPSLKVSLVGLSLNYLPRHTNYYCWSPPAVQLIDLKTKESYESLVSEEI